MRMLTFALFISALPFVGCNREAALADTVGRQGVPVAEFIGHVQGCTASLVPSCTDFVRHLRGSAELRWLASTRSGTRTAIHVTWNATDPKASGAQGSTWTAERTIETNFEASAVLALDLETLLVSGDGADGPIVELWQWTLPDEFWSTSREFTIPDPTQLELDHDLTRALIDAIGTPLHGIPIRPTAQSATPVILLLGDAGRMMRVAAQPFTISSSDPFLRVDLHELGTDVDLRDVQLMQWRGDRVGTVYAVQAPHPTHPRSILIRDQNSDGTPEDYQLLASMVLEGRPLSARGGEHGAVRQL